MRVLCAPWMPTNCLRHYQYFRRSWMLYWSSIVRPMTWVTVCFWHFVRFVINLFDNFCFFFPSTFAFDCAIFCRSNDLRFNICTHQVSSTWVLCCFSATWYVCLRATMMASLICSRNISIWIRSMHAMLWICTKSFWCAWTVLVNFSKSLRWVKMQAENN